MPSFEITSPEGKRFEINAPEGTTQEQALEYFKSNYKPEAVEKPTTNTSPLSRFLIGAQSAGEGIGQAIAHALPEDLKIPVPRSDEYITPKQYLEFGEKQRQANEAANKAANVGMDVAGFTGSLLNPLAGVSKNPLVQGAVLGATQPVPEESYGANKALQSGAGALGGYALNKLAGKVAGFVPKSEIEKRAESSLASEGMLADIEKMNVPESVKTTIQGNLLTALRSGKKYDIDALARKAEAEQLGIDLTRGQATRDPALWSQEVNLRGASKAIRNRLTNQQNILRDLMSSYKQGAEESYPAGNKIIESLRAKDEASQANIGNLYKAARESENADYQLPMEGLAQDYARIVNDFGDAIPNAVRKQFEDYGLLSGQKLKMLTPVAADKLEKTISQHYGNERATNNALGQLKTALRDAVNNGLEGSGPFYPAVKAAAQRFKEHEVIPAIPAAVEGKVSADKFIDKFVINDSTDNVKRLAGHMDRESFNQAKAQLGQYLNDKMYGTNTSGDKKFSAEGLAKALRSLGTEKLSAFFDPKEIDTLKMISRVGANISSEPAESFANRSNTAVSLMQNLPAVKFATDAVEKTPVLNLLPLAIQHFKVNQALSGNIPMQDINKIQQNSALAEQLRKYGGLAGGIAGGQSVNQ